MKKNNKREKLSELLASQRRVGESEEQFFQAKWKIIIQPLSILFSCVVLGVIGFFVYVNYIKIDNIIHNSAISLDNGILKINSPNFTVIENNGLKYQLQAEKYEQDISSKNLIKIDRLKISQLSTKSDHFTISADKANLNIKEMSGSMSGNIHFIKNSQYEISMDEVDFNLSAGNFSSNRPVNSFFDGGFVRSGNITLSETNETVTLAGGVYSIIKTNYLTSLSRQLKVNFEYKYKKNYRDKSHNSCNELLEVKDFIAKNLRKENSIIQADKLVFNIKDSLFAYHGGIKINQDKSIRNLETVTVHSFMSDKILGAMSRNPLGSITIIDFEPINIRLRGRHSIKAKKLTLDFTRNIAGFYEVSQCE